VTIVAFIAMVSAGLHKFVVGTLADDRLEYQEAADWRTTRSARVNGATLAEGVDHYPDSARLQHRLAEAQMLGGTEILQAESHALEAIRLSPYDYKLRELLASIRESLGDRAGAEQSQAAAVALAPNYVEAHWRLANLLLRAGKQDEAVIEFKDALANDASLLPITLSQIWQASGGNVDKLLPLPTDDQGRIELAEFLLKHHRVEDAAAIFARTDRSAKVASARAPDFLNALIRAGQFRVARLLWASIVSADWRQVQAGILWNGGFESDILLKYAQFDWAIAAGDYAQISIDTANAHGGGRSLEIDFVGRDTTRLSDEIGQMILVRPGASYRVEWFSKTDSLVTPKGPWVEVTSLPGQAIAASASIAEGSADWAQMTLDFTAPSGAGDSVPLLLKIVRRPEFSYDSPTKGRVWFDDFSIKELKKSR
jgi:tetratricopeptide (TPR) repeat protein